MDWVVSLRKRYEALRKLLKVLLGKAALIAGGAYLGFGMTRRLASVVYVWKSRAFGGAATGLLGKQGNCSIRYRLYSEKGFFSPWNAGSKYNKSLFGKLGQCFWTILLVYRSKKHLQWFRC